MLQREDEDGNALWEVGTICIGNVAFSVLNVDCR